MPSLLAMTKSAFDPASRVRLIQLIPGLEKAGWQVDHRPNVPDRLWASPLSGRWVRAAHHRLGRLQMKWNRWKDVSGARRYDAVFVNRDLAGGGTLFERRLLSRNPRVVFDFDDAIFIGPNEPSVAWMCAHAAWVTPGNDYLAEYAGRFTSRVTAIPTMIDTDRYHVCPARPAAAPVRVGWSGSDQSIAEALFPFLPMLEAMQEQLGFEFIVITNTRPTLPVSRLRFTFVPWKAEEEGELGRHMDIGLMPLVDNAFQRGKCGLKLLQYMAAGIPTVASPVGVNASITVPGETGFLAATDEEWGAALTALVHSVELRGRLGAAGRRRCMADYSVLRWLPRLVDIFERVAAKGPGREPESPLAAENGSDGRNGPA